MYCIGYKVTDQSREWHIIGVEFDTEEVGLEFLDNIRGLGYGTIVEYQLFKLVQVST